LTGINTDGINAMALLQWKDRYSVGIEAVDHEHKELIGLINRLHDEWVKGGSRGSVEAFFGDLYKAANHVDSVRRSSVMRCQFTREVRLDEQVGDFRRALGCLGRANLRMGPPQRFPLAVSGKITQIFLETQVIWGMSDWFCSHHHRRRGECWKVSAGRHHAPNIEKRVEGRLLKGD
jgi:hypothetical protein